MAEQMCRVSDEIELCYETFGDPLKPTALLIMILLKLWEPLAITLVAESAIVFGALVAGGVLREWIGALDLEGMRRRAQADHGTATVQVGVEMLHLFRWKLLKPQEDDCQVGSIKRLHAGHVGVAGHDFAAVLVDVKQHRALEAVMFSKNSR